MDVVSIMMTASNGNIFRVNGHLWGESTSHLHVDPPHKERPVMQSFDVFFDLRLNKWSSKQLRRQWFEMPSCSLWHHQNDRDCLVPCKGIPIIKVRGFWDCLILRMGIPILVRQVPLHWHGLLWVQWLIISKKKSIIRHENITVMS